jgi:hypothetical protein
MYKILAVPYSGAGNFIQPPDRGLGGGDYKCSVQILHTREVRLEEVTERLYNLPAAGKKKIC